MPSKKHAHKISLESNLNTELEISIFSELIDENSSSLLPGEDLFGLIQFRVVIAFILADYIVCGEIANNGKTITEVLFRFGNVARVAGYHVRVNYLMISCFTLVCATA